MYFLSQLKRFEHPLESVPYLSDKPQKFILFRCFVILFVCTLGIRGVEAQDSEPNCNIACGGTVGGQSAVSSWNEVSFFTKTIYAPNYDTDLLSTYAAGGNTFVPGSTAFGVGVAGPNNSNDRLLEINYIAEESRSEKLLIDFGGCNSFTGAVITLAKFYGLEGGDYGEAGCWRAFDADFELVGQGTFIANKPIGEGNSGLFTLNIKTGATFRYLEFTAKPYVPSPLKSSFADNSDYLVQKIVPTCSAVVECDDIIGGTNEFSSWDQVAITTRPFSGAFSASGSEVFVADEAGIAGTNGVGVPNDASSEINYDGETGKSEALRVHFGKNLAYAQFTVARLFEGEVGYWVAYKTENCELVEVGSGSFTGEEESGGIIKSGGTAGQRTVSVQTTNDFEVVEFTSGPTQSSKSDKSGLSAGYVLHKVAACPICSGAYEVIKYTPGKRKNGQPIDAAFTNPNNALGEPQNTNLLSPVNFVSLGFDGCITLKFAQPFTNGPGADLNIIETSEQSCESYLEEADVFASQDGVDFMYLGRICQDGQLDLGMLSWAQYVKIDDKSKRVNFTAVTADGYDLDGITCLNGIEENPVPDDFGGCSAQSVLHYAPGNKKSGHPISLPFRNPAKALGDPDSFDKYPEYVALGFGNGRTLHEAATKGYIDLDFNFAIYDEPGKNDLLVVETSYGNPQFRAYPEQAEVYASKDAVNWVFLGKTNANNPATDCNKNLDTEFDFEGKIDWARYIKIVDITNPNALKRKAIDCATIENKYAFNNSSDGFDLDAVVCLNTNYGESAARLKNASGKEIVERDVLRTPVIFPNPADNRLFIDFSEVAEFVMPDQEVLVLKIYDIYGKPIHNKKVEIGDSFIAELDITKLAKGIYIIRLEADGFQKSLKFVK
jgi:hypothetical protein